MCTERVHTRGKERERERGQSCGELSKVSYGGDGLPSFPPHAVTEVFEMAVGPCKTSKSQRETTKIG